MREIPVQCVQLVMSFEVFRDTAYKCPAGVWTIGYGHTGNVHPGDFVTQVQAQEMLRDDLAMFGRAVERLILVSLNDNQFSALVSFTFNVGEHNLLESTLRKRLNKGDYACVPDQLARWNKGGGKVLSGLVKRRKAEGELWLKEV